MHGWRARIGLLVPSINTIMEPEMWRTAPDGVTVHTARIEGGREGTPDELRRMEDASRSACERVSMTEPHAVVYACTSGSFFEGRDWNEQICEQLTAISGAPTITTAGAMAASMARAPGEAMAPGGSPRWVYVLYGLSATESIAA